MKQLILIISIALLSWIVPIQSVNAGGKSFPKIVFAQAGAPPEGFTIGKGSMAYAGSIDGSIYKMNLRTGQGMNLVPAEPSFDVFAGDCYKLGMRVDPRSNYLFVAGCINGDAYVFDADSGEQIMHYQLDDSGNSNINDIAITHDAVYFTDFRQPFIYRLPLSKNGMIPDAADAATAIALTGDWTEGGGASANGIVATPNGKTLIVGHSGLSNLFRVDPASGEADEIVVTPALPQPSFLDAIVLHDGLLYILSPFPESIQVVDLSDDMLTGHLLGTITDPNMDGVASGAFFGGSLYVNNARYNNFPGCYDPEDDSTCTQYWITKLNVKDIEP